MWRISGRKLPALRFHRRCHQCPTPLVPFLPSLLLLPNCCVGNGWLSRSVLQSERLVFYIAPKLAHFFSSTSRSAALSKEALATTSATTSTNRTRTRFRRLQDGFLKVQEWPNSLNSLHYLLYKTPSWNRSRLHWREARRLLRIFLQNLQSPQEKVEQEQRQDYFQGISRSRLVLQLIERAMKERQEQQQQQSSKINLNSVENRHEHEGFPLFRTSPQIISRFFAGLWRREQELYQQQSQPMIKEELGEDNESYRQNQQKHHNQGLNAVVPTRQELREWIQRHDQNLVAIGLKEHLEKDLNAMGMMHSTNAGAIAPHPALPRVSTLNLLSRLEKLAIVNNHNKNVNDADADADADIQFKNIQDINNALANVDFQNRGQDVFRILQLLWQISELQPNSETYYKAMRGVLMARLQPGIYYKNTGDLRPTTGTSRVLMDLFTEMLRKHEEVDRGQDVMEEVGGGSGTLSPGPKHYQLLLKTMEQEESNALGRHAWFLWDHNLYRKSCGRRYVPPSGELGQLVMTVLSRSHPGEVPDLEGKAVSILKTMIHEAHGHEARKTSREEAKADADDANESGNLFSSLLSLLTSGKGIFDSGKNTNVYGNPFLPLDRKFWVAFLECLVKNNHKAYIHDAQVLFMHDKVFSSQQGYLEPDVKMYGVVLRALGRSGSPEVASNFFEHMLNTSDEYLDAIPDAKTILDAVLAWTDCERLSPFEKREGIHNLLELVVHHNQRTDVPPALVNTTWSKKQSTLSESDDKKNVVDIDGDNNTAILSSLLRMLSATGIDFRNADRAELILKACDLGKEKYPELTPTIKDYCAVIAALSRSKEATHAAQRAENILFGLIQRAEADSAWEPPEHAFTSAITCWARSNEKGAAARAQNIFDLMEIRYNNGQSTVQPSVKTYSALILAWAMEGDLKRAEFVLNRMLRDFQNGNQMAEPDRACFNIVLEGWDHFARNQRFQPKVGAHHDQAYNRASAILDLMKKLYESSVLREPPDASTYAFVIGTLAHSDREDKADLARAHLQEAIARYKASGYSECRPDVFLYGAVIQVLSKTFSIKKGGSREVALDIEGYLDKMRSLGQFDERQTLLAHEAAIHAWMTLSPQLPEEAVDRAEFLMQQLEEISKSRRERGKNCRLAKPNSGIWFKLLKLYILSGMPTGERQARALRLLKKMRYSQVPVDEKLAQLFDECGVDSKVPTDAALSPSNNELAPCAAPRAGHLPTNYHLVPRAGHLPTNYHLAPQAAPRAGQQIII